MIITDQADIQASAEVQIDTNLEEEKVRTDYDFDAETLAHKLEVRRKCKGNGGRPRENLEECAPERC